jgi:small subunit ribosomal protein S26e
MPKKRKSRGRSKGAKGKMLRVHCSGCGALVPKDKVKKVTIRRSVVEPDLAKELREKGAFIPTSRLTKYYCISCAMFHGVVSARAREVRKLPGRIG